MSVREGDTLEIPDFIIHYSRGEPFRSISGVPKDKLPAVIKELSETNAWGLERFSDSKYLEQRLVVEKKIREDFIAKGGTPQLLHPIYFFLGRNLDFDSHESNRGYRIRLRDLPKGSVSFTYGDSMFSLNEENRKLRGGAYLGSLCRQIYVPEELPFLFSHQEFQSAERLHVEAQLWIAPSEATISL